MAERFFAVPVGVENASAFDTDLRVNKGVVKDTITYTPVSRTYLIATYYNDIPVVTLADGATTTYEYGSDEPTWSTLVDVTDGDHSSGFVIKVVSSDLDMDVIGDYTVSVTATDASGNVSEALDIDITIEDTTVPVINDAETLTTTYVTGSDEPDWTTGITATDGYDGDITGDIVVGDSAVDMVTVGTFAVTYDVDDSSGNSAVQVSKTITITAE